MVEIITNIWLGNIKVSQSEEFIKRKNIKLIINCDRDINLESKFDSQENIKSSLLKYYSNITNQIYKHIIDGSSVLIYGSDIEQKAPSIIVAYLILFGNMEYNNCIFTIQNKFNSKYYPNILIEEVLKKL